MCGYWVNGDLHLLNTLTSVLEKSDGSSDDIASDLDSDFEEMDGDFDNEFGNIQGPLEHPTRLGETSNYIRYGCTNLTTLSNSWEDPQYFATAFLTLFPTGLGGHLDERSVKVSLEAFGKWALSHHSRRYVINTYNSQSALPYNCIHGQQTDIHGEEATARWRGYQY